MGNTALGPRDRWSVLVWVQEELQAEGAMTLPET
jgi:hypothetical protein